MSGVVHEGEELCFNLNKPVVPPPTNAMCEKITPPGDNTPIIELPFALKVTFSIEHGIAIWPRAINRNEVRHLVSRDDSGKGKLLHPYGAIHSLSKPDRRSSRHGDVGCSLARSLDGNSFCNVDAVCSPGKGSCRERDRIAIL